MTIFYVLAGSAAEVSFAMRAKESAGFADIVLWKILYECKVIYEYVTWRTCSRFPTHRKHSLSQAARLEEGRQMN